MGGLGEAIKGLLILLTILSVLSVLGIGLGTYELVHVIWH